MVVAIDVAIGLVVLWVWCGSLCCVTPSWTWRRIREDTHQAPIAVAIGSGTHVLWDSASR